MSGPAVDKTLRVMEEIISTETTYVSELTTLIEVYIKPMRNQSIVDREAMQQIFSNWELLHGFNTRLLQDLVEHKNGPDGVKGVPFGRIFNDFSHFFKMYSDYLQNYENALEKVSELSQRSSAFDRIVQAGANDPRCRGKNLTSYLIMPVQRIPRYKMLLEELHKRTDDDWFDKPNLLKALETVGNAAKDNNEKIRQRENRMKIFEIQTHFDSSKKPDLFGDPSRMFIKEGPLIKLCRRGPKEFFFWLFSDKIVYGQASGETTYQFHREIDLRYCRVSMEPPQSEEGLIENVDKAFLIESNTKSFIVWAQLPAEKIEWVDDINECIGKLQQGIDGQVAPVWRPDGSTNECEVCKSPFTLLRRRHHCRNCGDLVCSQCSTHKLNLPHINATTAQRVCDRCYDERDQIGKGNPTSQRLGFDFRRQPSENGDIYASTSSSVLTALRTPPPPPRQHSAPHALTATPSLPARSASSHASMGPPRRSPPQPIGSSHHSGRVVNLSHRIDANAPPPPKRAPPVPPSAAKNVLGTSGSLSDTGSETHSERSSFGILSRFSRSGTPSTASTQTSPSGESAEAKDRPSSGRPREGAPRRPPPQLPVSKSVDSFESRPTSTSERPGEAHFSNANAWRSLLNSTDSSEEDARKRVSYDAKQAARAYSTRIPSGESKEEQDKPSRASWRPLPKSRAPPTPRRQPPARLPEGWERFETAEGEEYFYNKFTAQTQWDRPTVAAAPPKPARRRGDDPSAAAGGSQRGLSASKDLNSYRIYDYDELAVPRTQLPADVNPNERELHLDDFQFQYYFYCTKEEFLQKPKWKRIQNKKEVHLF